MILFCFIVQPSNSIFCKVEHWAESWCALALSCFQLDRSAAQLRVRELCMPLLLPLHVTRLPSHAGRSMSKQASMALDITHAERHVYPGKAFEQVLLKCFGEGTTEVRHGPLVGHLWGHILPLVSPGILESIGRSYFKATIPGSSLMNSATYWWL